MTGLFDRINALDQDAFTRIFGALYEHSPWIARQAWEARPFADRQALLATCRDIVVRAREDVQMRLIRAHPELARRLGVDETLTTASRGEQSSAGLDRLTPEEQARFSALNAAYRARFDMPFIICVRLSEKAHILEQMEKRLLNTPAQERVAALGEIGRIAALRCEDLIQKLETAR